MFRRRPLARAAVVGGAAYAVGRHSGRNQAEDQMMQEQYNAPPPPPEPGLGADGAAELQRLAQLKDAGILTQAEFDMQKAKILAG